jgi:DNA (cytosine-5)-methyltransferase 1
VGACVVGGKPTFIDLFAGAGLFSAGLIRAGFEPVLAVELSLEAAGSYRRNVFDCVKQGSVENPNDTPRADVIIAGPPCQGFSTLGRRDPADTRSDLSLAILPWVRAARPQIVIVENVPPFIASMQWARLKRAMQRMGFSVCIWELEAAQFGTPQRRRRVFTVASRRGPIEAPLPRARSVSAGEVLFDPSRPLRSDDPMHVWPEPKGLAAKRIRLIPPRGDKRDIVAKAPSLCPPSWLKLGCQATDAWGRLDPDEPANTIRCTFQNPSKGRYLHPTENRVLSLREGARLQGVPDGWIFVGLPYPIARQIGNGVPVKLAKAVGRRIAASLG